MGKKYNIQDQVSTLSRDMETMRENQKKMLGGNKSNN